MRDGQEGQAGGHIWFMKCACGRRKELGDLLLLLLVVVVPV
jgi:hypothetical protein